MQERGPGVPPPLLLDQTEAQRGEKNFFGDRAPRYLRVWINAPPPYLKVWIWHCQLPENLDLWLN